MFPRSYEAAIEQAQKAVSASLQDGCKLLEIEFPAAGLSSVPGDGEGANEMTLSMGYLRKFCRMFELSGEAPGVRIFFPERKELALATEGNQDNEGQEPMAPRFRGVRFQLDYLTQPTGLMDIGLDLNQSKASARVKDSDKLFVIAYPHFNVNEMLSVEELWQDTAKETGRPIIVFNGELDRIRSGYYPSLFYPKIGKLAKNFLPKFVQPFYIHNFKGSKGGALFRCYPGPWQVLRRDDSGDLEVVEVRDDMPSLKEVALDILPKH
eukprot:evm.model.scf_1809.2 EVM.evm.TU.scf_1809.2   scf_1809:10936-14172(+)